MIPHVGCEEAALGQSIEFKACGPGTFLVSHIRQAGPFLGINDLDGVSCYQPW